MVPINPALQEKAKGDLNENLDRIAEDIDHIKDWIKKEPHLNARSDDQWILSFLRGSKFSLQKAKDKIDCNYTMRTLIPEYFSNRNPFSPEIQKLLEKGFVLPLPKTEDITGPRLVFVRWDDCNPNEFSLEQLTKVGSMIIDILLNEDPQSAICGIKFVEDYKSFNVNYILQFTPSFLQKMIACLQSAYPIRLKGLYIFNAPQLFEKVYSMAKLIMNEKMKRRVAVYSETNFHKVFDKVPQYFFPIEYQGTNGSIPDLTAEWKKKVESYKDWFEEGESHGTQENLRRGKPTTSADLFGVEGTFRKLDLD